MERSSRLGGQGARSLMSAFIVGAFALGTSENIIAGILPDLAGAFHVSVPSVGLLASVYAGTAVVAGPVIALWAGRVPLRRLTLVAMTGYLMGSIAALCASSYPVMLVARIMTGALHTTVLVAFMVAALQISSPQGSGVAVSRITLGLGLATVVGIPMGNALAQRLGWRWSFAVIVALMTVSLGLCLRDFPRTERTRARGKLADLRVLLKRPVGAGISMSAMAGLGAMMVLAYAVPFLNAAGVYGSALTFALMAYGAACLAGNVTGGKIADRNLPLALFGSLSATGAALLCAAMLAATAPSAILCLALVGFTYFCTFAPLNTWIAESTSGASIDLCLAMNSSAFNIGITLAGWAGGLVLSSHLGPDRLPLLGAGALLISGIIATTLPRMAPPPQ